VAFHRAPEIRFAFKSRIADHRVEREQLEDVPVLAVRSQREEDNDPNL
jgi:hypothetical protein